MQIILRKNLNACAESRLISFCCNKRNTIVAINAMLKCFIPNTYVVTLH